MLGSARDEAAPLLGRAQEQSLLRASRTSSEAPESPRTVSTIWQSWLRHCGASYEADRIPPPARSARMGSPLRQDGVVNARLRLADLLAGLSVTSSLGFGLPAEHAMHACLIGTALAREMGLDEEEVADVFYATLLLHVGCTALAHESVATWGDDVTLLGIVARTNTA